MAAVTLANGEVVETGCVLDGHFGWYNTERVVTEVAAPLGFKLTPHDLRACRLYAESGVLGKWHPKGSHVEDREMRVVEHVTELANDAEDYLNSITPEGYTWEWDDGFYFWKVEDEDNG